MQLELDLATFSCQLPSNKRSSGTNWPACKTVQTSPQPRACNSLHNFPVAALWSRHPFPCGSWLGFTKMMPHYSPFFCPGSSCSVVPEREPQIPTASEDQPHLQFFTPFGFLTLKRLFPSVSSLNYFIMNSLSILNSYATWECRPSPNPTHIDCRVKCGSTCLTVQALRPLSHSVPAGTTNDQLG